jgi:hypothetical protein
MTISVEPWELSSLSAEQRVAIQRYINARIATHTPVRGSDVEAWIRRRRDRYTPGYSDWHALHALLDDYRAHADAGTPLDRDVQVTV